MGYYIRSVQRKTEIQPWKLQFITHKKVDTQSSTAKRPRKEWDIPQRNWGTLGFHSQMSLEIAQLRAKQLNAQRELRRQEERRRHFDEKMMELNLKSQAALPEIFKDEFEKRNILNRHDDRQWIKRTMTSWRAAQRMLIELQLDPMHWFDETTQFYDYLHRKRFSYSYGKKILLLTNIWGLFLSRKLNQTFTRVPYPRGKEKVRLLEAYFSKKGGHTNQSDPLPPEKLENEKENLKEENYNWLFLSVWLGLRPLEIDQLKKKELVRVQRGVGRGIVLWVYQTKLISVPPRYRWKLIPVFLKEQRKAVKIIKSGNFKRPLVKTVRSRFGRHTSLYGGRKGFTDLMLSQGQEFVNISQWMGHSSIDRTWRSYKSRRITHHSPANQVVFGQLKSWKPVDRMAESGSLKSYKSVSLGVPR